MAILDVSDAFDACMLTKMSLIHRAAVLDDEGVFSFIEGDPQSFYGVVTPNGEAPTDARENQFIVDSITVFSRIPMHPQTEREAADVILYDGRRYVVKSANSYSVYGSGFWNVVACLDNREESENDGSEIDPT